MRSAATVLLMGLTLTACTSSSDPAGQSGADVGDAPVAPDETVACTYLTAQDRERLAGTALDTVVAADAREGGTQCRWSSEAGLIQITSIPATAWVRSLPDVLAQLEAPGQEGPDAGQANLARVKELLRDADSFDAAQACDAFSLLAEIDGEPAGTTTTLSYLPINDTQRGISAQTCTDGVLTSLVFSEPGLQESAAQEKSIRTILAAAQKRATG